MDKSNSKFLHLGATILISMILFFILAVNFKTETPLTDFLLTTICVHLIYSSYITKYK